MYNIHCFFKQSTSINHYIDTSLIICILAMIVITHWCNKYVYFIYVFNGLFFVVNICLLYLFYSLCLVHVVCLNLVFFSFIYIGY